MAGPLSARPPNGNSDNGISITGADTARYTRDMLENLKRIAVQHEQFVLARLLEAAAREAARLGEAGRH